MYLPSSALNEQLPPWLRITGEERLRLEGFSGNGFQPDSDDAYLLSRLRLNLGVLPADWMKFQFQMQDSRLTGKNLKPYSPPFQNTFDLRLSYAEFGDTERNHYSLRFGRQELNLGEERLIGSSDWVNAPRSFDAARLSLHQGRYRLDLFAASPVVLHDGDVGDHVPGNNLHGLYGGLDSVVPQAKIEPYLFWRLNQRQKTETGTTGDLDFTTVGVRWVGKLNSRFDYAFEAARQQGSLGTDRIAAWAGHWLVGYVMPVPGKSHLTAEFNYATGDGDGKDGRRHTFDQLFASGHEKYGLADQVGWKNIVHCRTGVEWRLGTKWLAATKLGAYWLADAHDALYNSAGTALARSPGGTAGRFVGTELDGSATYVYSKQLKIGAGLGHLFAGSFLQSATPGRGYSYPYLALTATL